MKAPFYICSGVYIFTPSSSKFILDMFIVYTFFFTTLSPKFWRQSVVSA